ncbi:MAG: hypothetical protein AAF640_12390 [Pseudomonadota bacterium]
MKERPILFSGSMVRAILEGMKTQTRRVVKPTKDKCGFGVELAPCEVAGEINAAEPSYHLCPYGSPGDQLWVRETFRAVEQAPWQHDETGECELEYRASTETHLHWGEREPKWKPSIHMPRWASRITLQVTGVRVERLQDISKDEAESEGIQYLVSEEGHPLLDISSKDSPLRFLNEANRERFRLGDRSGVEFDYVNWARAHFAALWESINGRGSWDANPWVWVIEFERMEAAHG